MIAALCNFFNLTAETQADKFAFVMALLVIGVYILFPFAAFYVMHKYLKSKDGLRSEEYKEKFAVLTSDLRQDSNLSLAYLFVFLGRRLALILLFIHNESQTQLLVFPVLQVFVGAYLAFIRSSTTATANLQCIIGQAALIQNIVNFSSFKMRKSTR